MLGENLPRQPLQAGRPRFSQWYVSMDRLLAKFVTILPYVSKEDDDLPVVVWCNARSGLASDLDLVCDSTDHWTVWDYQLRTDRNFGHPSRFGYHQRTKGSLR